MTIFFKPYNPKGRFQTEAEAKNIDLHIQPFLQSPGDKEKAWDLVNEILTRHPE